MIHAQFDPTARQLLAATAVEAKTRKDQSWQQIADAAGLNERYVREWLGGVAAGLSIDVTGFCE